MHGGRRLLPALLALACSFVPAFAVEFGVYEGPGWNGRRQLERFQAWFGRKPDLVLDFLDHRSWPALEASAQWLIPAWAGHKLVLGIPLTVRGSPLTEVANGVRDPVYRRVAETLVAQNQANAILRLGWEANGSWFPWSAAPNPDLYVAAFRHVVGIMRSVPGARFRFDWSTSAGQSAASIAPARFYPGDYYVDYIGQDVYAQTWTGKPSLDRVMAELWANNSLEWLARFAREHHKPISIPEWGTGERQDGHGLGDSGAFVERLADWVVREQVSFAIYWDSRSEYDSEISGGSHPQAGAAVKTAFGQPPDGPR